MSTQDGGTMIPPAWIGRIRRLLMIRGEHRWNAWVRDITAKLG